jgi:hypothetical protein
LQECTLDTSHTLAAHTRQPDSEWSNSVRVRVGPVEADIPMHPGFLHEVVVRHTAKINEQLTRFNPPMFDEVECVELNMICIWVTSSASYPRASPRGGRAVGALFAEHIESTKDRHDRVRHQRRVCSGWRVMLSETVSDSFNSQPFI